MIDRQTISKLSTKYQTRETNIAREYLQHLFLSYFYTINPHIYFKGGTALRIVHKSSRFSEDLDFSASMVKISEIEGLIYSTVDRIQKEGIDLDVNEAKSTSGGYLAEIHSKLYEYQIKISLQVSLRKKELERDLFVIVNDFVPDYTLLALDQATLVEEKITACIERSKPRDFYDVYFLLRAGLIDVNQRKRLTIISERLKELDITFDNELKEFLPVSLHGVIRNFKENLEREISRF